MALSCLMVRTRSSCVRTVPFAIPQTTRPIAKTRGSTMSSICHMQRSPLALPCSLLATLGCSAGASAGRRRTAGTTDWDDSMCCRNLLAALLNYGYRYSAYQVASFDPGTHPAAPAEGSGGDSAASGSSNMALATRFRSPAQYARSAHVRRHPPHVQPTGGLDQDDRQGLDDKLKEG